MVGGKNKVINTLCTILLIGIVCFICFPVLWTFSNAFRASDAEIFRNAARLSIRTLIPESFTLSNFYTVVIENKFYIPLINSLIVAVATIIGGVILNGLAGFAFAKFHFRGKNLLFAVCLFPLSSPLK